VGGEGTSICRIGGQSTVLPAGAGCGKHMHCLTRRAVSSGGTRISQHVKVSSLLEFLNSYSDLFGGMRHCFGPQYDMS
jgi:hypothetical protein